MPQTTYQNDFTTAVPGQIDGDAAGYDIVSFPASEDIPAGRLVELANGQVRLPQQTGSSLTPVGVACYLSAFPPGNSSGNYHAGDMVPCVRRGRVYASTTGATPGQLVSANVNHSSTTATDRGKFTTTATATTAGSEIAASAGVTFFSTPSDVSNVSLVEVAYS